MRFIAKLGLVYLALLASLASALVPALIAGLYLLYLLKARTWRVALALLAWGLYAYYEHLIQSGVLCGKECNIRVDLLLIAPILAYCSVLPQRADAARRETT